MQIPIDSPHFLGPEMLNEPPDWRLVFGNDRPLALEIGCGTGDFVSQIAGIHREWNFIAIDYYNKGCLKTCKKIDAAGLDNVRVARAEARDFLTSCIPKGSLQAVFINCPDPWPKKRHRKRRLVNSLFVRFLWEFMRPGADFHFATDFADYGLDVAGFMPEQKGYENALSPDMFRHVRPEYPLSRYMLKFMSDEKPIYFVHYRKISREEP